MNYLTFDFTPFQLINRYRARYQAHYPPSRKRTHTYSSSNVHSWRFSSKYFSFDVTPFELIDSERGTERAIQHIHTEVVRSCNVFFQGFLECTFDFTPFQHVAPERATERAIYRARYPPLFIFLNFLRTPIVCLSWSYVTRQLSAKYKVWLTGWLRIHRISKDFFASFSATCPYSSKQAILIYSLLWQLFSIIHYYYSCTNADTYSFLILVTGFTKSTGCSKRKDGRLDLRSMARSSCR